LETTIPAKRSNRNKTNTKETRIVPHLERSPDDPNLQEKRFFCRNRSKSFAWLISNELKSSKRDRKKSETILLFSARAVPLTITINTLIQ